MCSYTNAEILNELEGMHRHDELESKLANLMDDYFAIDEEERAYYALSEWWCEFGHYMPENTTISIEWRDWGKEREALAKQIDQVENELVFF